MIVDITLTLRGQSFEWDAEKAASNFAKHGVAFPEACEVFFDPFFHLVDATAEKKCGKRLSAIRRMRAFCLWCI